MSLQTLESFRLRPAPAASRDYIDPTSGYWTIGGMSRAFGVSLRALRFYEDRGLLSPMRQGAGRFYDENQRIRLRLILRGKQLGFTLVQIRELLASNAETDSKGENGLQLAPDQVAHQLASLERQRETLDLAIAQLRLAQNELTQPAMARAG